MLSERGPRSVYAHNSLAIQLAQMGRLDEALRVYQTALDLDPFARGVRNNIASVYLSRSQADMALAFLEEEKKQSPHLPLVHFNTGQATLLRGDVLRASREFIEELRLNPSEARAAYHLARCYQDLGETNLSALASTLASTLAP